jgi:hypothetical protein
MYEVQRVAFAPDTSEQEDRSKSHLDITVQVSMDEGLGCPSARVGDTTTP